MVAVEAFGLGPAGKPEQQDNVVGPRGRACRLVRSVFVDLVAG